MATTRSDQAARDRIRTALDENQLVLAGAGAGKTYALVERMVQTVRAGKAHVDQMAAITFTRKAAGEMRGRFDRRLRTAADEATGDVRRRLDRACAEIGRCFIGTIHAFCGRLLRERPLAAGLPPDFTEVEPREAKELQREAWDAFVAARYAADDPRLDRLDALGLRTEDLYDFFARRNAYREVPLKETTTARPDLETAVQSVRALLDEVEALMPEDRPKGRDPLMEAAEQARHFLRHHGLRSDADRVRLLRMLSGPPDVKVTYWGDERAVAKTLRDERLPAFDEKVLQPVLRQWRQYVYRHVTGFVDDAVDHYRTLRYERGQLTFQDLLLKSAALLRDHPDVRRSFQARYRRLFVDEFQDTDPIQARVLFYLTGMDTAERDWRALQPRPGSLFLVGDAKQSIYRFRRADLDTFRFVGERIEATGGAVLRLNTSFRSLGAFCDWANAAFADVFADEDETYQALFAPLDKHRPDSADTHCVRQLTVEKVYRNRRRDIVAEEAVRIADFIAAACAGKTALNAVAPDALLGPTASPGDFMILTPDKRPLKWYAEALEARGLPYDITGGGTLGSAEEVQALVEMLEAVKAPDNPLPLVGYLRGPLVGLGDDELYAFKQAGGAFDYRRPIPEDLVDETRARFGRALSQLRKAAADVRSLSPSAAIEHLLDRLRLVPFAATRPLGSSRAGNLLRVGALVRQWAGRGMHWGAIVDELRALVDEADYEIEEMTLEAARIDVVRIMNLHQAKGLQAPVVFLADPYSARRGRHAVGLHVTRRGGASYLSMPVRRARGPYHAETIAEPAGWEEDAAEEQRYQDAEADRLLYVAATRARNLLVVSRYAPKPEDGPWAKLYPALDGVPELPHDEVSPATSSGEVLPDWPAQRKERQRRLRRVQRPSYRATYASDSAIRFPGRETRIEDRGALVRHVLAAAAEGRLPSDERAYLQSFIDATNTLDETVCADVERILGRFQASNLWRAVQSAASVYTAVPFAFNEAVKDDAALVHGCIDLVYCVAGGDHIVGFAVEPAAHFDNAALRVRHDARLTTHAAYWKQAAERHVASISLWLAESGRRIRW